MIPRPLAALLALALGGCSASAGAVVSDAATEVALGTPVDSHPAVGCVLALDQKSGQTCFAEWSCPDAGVLVLACGPADGSVACACGPESVAATGVAGAPLSCSQADVTTFARNTCGWSWL